MNLLSCLTSKLEIVANFCAKNRPLLWDLFDAGIKWKECYGSQAHQNRVTCWKKNISTLHSNPIKPAPTLTCVLLWLSFGWHGDVSNKSKPQKNKDEELPVQQCSNIMLNLQSAKRVPIIGCTDPERSMNVITKDVSVDQRPCANTANSFWF